MTQAQQYTKAIAELPDRTRHIVAGIVAWRLDFDDDGSWADVWRMAHDHGKHYPWPNPYELRAALRLIGLPSRIANEAVAIYASYGPDVKTADGSR